MTGKELILKTLRHEKTDRIPWIPFAGVHAGKLIGVNAKEILTNEEKLLESLLEVNKLYRPDGQPVMFDLQIEAEVLGCELQWAEDAPPAVRTHPLAETKELPCICQVPQKTDGRIPMVLDVMKKLKKKVGDTTALYGLTCGPFTLASHLRGTNIFMDMFEDPEYVKALIHYANEINIKMAEYYIEAGMDVIAVVDPLISQISPKHFKKFLTEPYTKLFDFIREKKAFSSFFVCGDATRSIDVMCQTNPDSISIDENVDMVAAKEVSDKHNIAMGGNIPLTTVMLHGTQQDNMKYTLELMDNLSHKNLIIAPGCDMPYDVPVENTIAVQQTISDPEKTRETIANYEVVEEDIDIEIPDYGSLEKPLVEVFTLDSATCAACTYMMNSANDMKEHFGDKIDIVEYKWTIKENIARVKKMGVKNLPSIYINGQLKYSSIIPSRDEFVKEIKAFM
ncbi:MAG: uroporphyrinogen decarboxylase family protein [Clostridia bacterium]|nr:uroporphyrinogen decarboxylase family protein [Clostridia bacterium]